MNSKILSCHLNRPAYIYLRQSTPGQVRHHQQSTERQYDLQVAAHELGWSPHLIHLLDADLGQSASSPNAPREDFKTLVTDVSMGKVGAVFALEASRLARCCADWHRLLELAAISGTLIVDEDGCYDPADFNDQLLLGLKGAMSQAELHFLRARLQGGKLHKARKGELRFPMAVGFCHDELGRIILDPDQQVQHALRLVFETFRHSGSAYGVVHHFADHGLLFPKRAYGGAWAGKLRWEPLIHGRVLAILKNPAYAGVYVYGRYRSVRGIDGDGRIHCRTTKLPMESWAVKIENHHPGYIDWPTFLQNQALLQKNCTVNAQEPLPSPVREGLTLLQGLLICGQCGRRLSVRYRGNGGIHPTYQCNRLKRDGLAHHACMSVGCGPMDQIVSHRALQVMEPAQIELALEALEQLHRQEQSLERQWQLRLQRAEYEAALAQRRYEQVDAANRLVAATLEQQWNQALSELHRLRQEHEQRRQENRLTVTEQQRNDIRRLAHDLPALWDAPTTEARDRKRILRLLIKDITVEKCADPKQLLLHLRWQGGACEDLVLQLPPSLADRLRYPAELVEQVTRLAQTMDDAKIAAELNHRRLRSATGKPFSASMIKWIRFRHDIPAPVLKNDRELTVQQVSERFGVSPYVVYYWIERGIILARRINAGSPWWITLDAATQAQLKKRVGESSKIPQNPKRKL